MSRSPLIRKGSRYTRVKRPTEGPGLTQGARFGPFFKLGAKPCLQVKRTANDRNALRARVRSFLES